MAASDALQAVGSPPRAQGSILLALTRTELRMGLRTGPFRLFLLLLFLLGLAVGAAPGRGGAMSAYATAETACRYLGLLVVAWMALLAVRETSLRTDILVYSKPQPTETLVLARF